MDRVIEEHAVVYVLWTASLPGNLEAAVDHRIKTLAAGTRCLWVLVRRAPIGDHLTSIIGHELQHAVEALESGAGTSADMERAFRQRAAVPAGTVYETTSAMKIQAQIAKELSGR